MVSGLALLRHGLRRATIPTLSLTRHLSPTGESLSSKWEALAVHAKFAVLLRASPLGELDAKRPERASPLTIVHRAQRLWWDEVGSVLAGGKDAADLIRTAGAVPVNE